MHLCPTITLNIFRLGMGSTFAKTRSQMSRACKRFRRQPIFFLRSLRNKSP
jgi:hypothetical protein